MSATRLQNGTPPSIDQLQDEVQELRGLAAEKEQSLRQAQEQINHYQRDWLYTTCNNFRGTVARLKRWKNNLVERGKIGVKLLIFAAGLLIAPCKAVLRAIGIGKRPPLEKDPADCQLKIGLTDPLPETIVVGKGNSFLVGGWAFHPHRRITHLELRLLMARPEPKPGIYYPDDEPALETDLPHGQAVEFTDKRAPVLLRNIPNRQVLTDHFPEHDFNGNSFWSGYQALVEIPPITRPGRAQLIVRASLDDGTIETVPLGKFAIQPAMPAPRPIPIPDGRDALIAVCMTTYNPPHELFRKQIESIKNQTHSRWICIIRDDGSKPAFVRMIQETIADDPRFVLRQNVQNLGFYKNFEAVLADVPREADYVALSDQDDCWHPDKLETLLRQFSPGTTLAYSDMNIVDETGRIKSPTYWTTRDNNYTHFPMLLLANTITGAASLFRRNLLEYLLPFPEKHGDAYHDHWLGCTAMALGEIRYVDRPLYDYVQHTGNVVGHVAPAKGSWLGAFYRFFAFFIPTKFSRNLNAFIRHGRGYYFADLLRIQHTARNVLTRCQREATVEKTAVLSKILNMADSWKGRLWLLLRPIRRRNSWRKTVGVERNLLHAMIWKFHLQTKAWWGTRLTARGILRGFMAKQCLPRPKVIETIDSVNAVTNITRPLTLEIRADSPRRVNVIVSIIDFKYVFGGYITTFQLCRKLVERGFRVRLIVTDECDFRPVTWADNFRSYPGLEDFLERIELLYCYNRHTVVPVSPDDTFLATSWWTAQVAKQAADAVGRKRFVFLVQEYEAGFYPYGSLFAFANEAYTYPHYALFSTELLREFFELSGMGVYGFANADRYSAVFENAITSVGEVTAEELRQPRRRRLLFYCRPEAHALRNMFDVGLLALRKAVQSGAFAHWDIDGIGAMKPGKIRLDDKVYMSLLPRLDQEQYRKILKDYDVGLSLMCSPHPSLVPIEMAAAGMWTVTNTYANKSPTQLKKISSNFLPVAPTVHGVVQGLFAACSRVREYETRAHGARVNWATTWDQAFPPAFLDRAEEFLLASMANRDAAEVRLRAA
jgi:glycosyltransferase involved in cell wall biosynthesis